MKRASGNPQRSITRRGPLAAAGAAGTAPVASPLAGAHSNDMRPDRRLLQMDADEPNAETPLDLLTTYITPNELFFVRHHWNVTAPDPRTWRFTVDGEVARPLSLSIADLKRFSRTTVTCVLECAGNGRAYFRPVVPGLQWGHGAVGNARWTGVRVRDLLAKARLKGSAKHLHTEGTDSPPGKVPPFHRSLELDKALEDAVVAYQMNGEPLPPLHGAPARLIIPGWAGDHWMKWLARLSPKTDTRKGFYMDAEYRYPMNPDAPGVEFKPEEMSPVTELFVKSTITDAPQRARAGSAITIRGVAFSGAPDVSRVEVTDDGGATWRAADLGREHDPHAWRLWSFRYFPKRAGKVTLHARATDSRGSIQPREAVWNQSGYLQNGWHSVEIE